MDVIFYSGLSLFMLHEMDAIRRQEWRIFFFLSKLKEETAYAVFSILHLAFARHRHNEFHSPLSWIIIVAMAFAGITHLLLR